MLERFLRGDVADEVWDSRYPALVVRGMEPSSSNPWKRIHCTPEEKNNPISEGRDSEASDTGGGPSTGNLPKCTKSVHVARRFCATH